MLQFFRQITAVTLFRVTGCRHWTVFSVETLKNDIVDPLFIPHDHRFLDEIFQLAHITRKIVGFQGFDDPV